MQIITNFVNNCSSYLSSWNVTPGHPEATPEIMPLPNSTEEATPSEQIDQFVKNTFAKNIQFAQEFLGFIIGYFVGTTSSAGNPASGAEDSTAARVSESPEASEAVACEATGITPSADSVVSEADLLSEVHEEREDYKKSKSPEKIARFEELNKSLTEDNAPEGFKYYRNDNGFEVVGKSGEQVIKYYQKYEEFKFESDEEAQEFRDFKKDESSLLAASSLSSPSPETLSFVSEEELSLLTPETLSLLKQGYIIPNLPVYLGPIAIA